MENKKTTINISGVLCMISVFFIAMKLDGFINWPWLIVLFPIWGASLVILAGYGIILTIIKIHKWWHNGIQPAFVAKGNPLVWDYKSGEMYGDYEKETDED